jgi:hypothetical protein
MTNNKFVQTKGGHFYSYFKSTKNGVVQENALAFIPEVKIRH